MIVSRAVPRRSSATPLVPFSSFASASASSSPPLTGGRRENDHRLPPLQVSINSSKRYWTEREAFSAPHSHVRLHAHPSKPTAQGLRRRTQVFLLGWNAAVRIAAQKLAVIGAAIVSEQNDALELVRLDQELQLVASGGVRNQQRYIPRYKPERPAWNGKAVVARDVEAFMAELVKRFTPAPIAAVDGHRADALRVPGMGAGEGRVFHFVVSMSEDCKPEANLFETPKPALKK